MNPKLLPILAALVAFGPISRASLADLAAALAAERQAKLKAAFPREIPLNEPRSTTLPTNVHTSIAPADLAKVPTVLKADRYAIGLLKWSPALGTAQNPVVGYEVQSDSNWPYVALYYATGTEFPFNVGMIEVVALEFWRVRTVFADGSRSAWAISKTFPERVTSRY